MGSCSGKPKTTAAVITVRRESQTSQRPESRISDGNNNNKYNETSINGDRKDEDSYLGNLPGNHVKNNSQQDLNSNQQQQYLIENKIEAQNEGKNREEDPNDMIVNSRRYYV